MYREVVYREVLLCPHLQLFSWQPSSAEALTPKSRQPPIMVLQDACRRGMTELFRLVGRETSDVVIEHYDIHSMYPFIAMQHKFICGPGIRLIGPMVSRLSLDYKQKCFVYTDPDTQDSAPDIWLRKQVTFGELSFSQVMKDPVKSCWECCAVLFGG